MTLAGRPEGKNKEVSMIEIKSWVDWVCAIFFGLLCLFTVCFFVAIIEAELEQRRREREKRQQEEE